MGLKVDLSGVKSFFVEKGERVGMFACLIAAGVLVGYGVMNGLGAKAVPGSTRTYSDSFKGRVDELRAKQNSGEQISSSESTNFSKDWGTAKPDFLWYPLSDRSDRTNNKRINPRALAPLVDPEAKQIQMDYVRGSYFAYDINQQFKTATVIKDAAKDPKAGKGFNPFQVLPGSRPAANVAVAPVITVQPLRMVTVHAVFPLSDQIQEFRKSFRMLSDYELFMAKDLPKFVGLNVMKTEVVPGKAPVWTPLVMDAGNEKLEVDPALMAMLRQAILDDTPQQNAHALIQGLAMPLPKLATLPPGNVFPKLEVVGVEVPEDNPNLPEGANPGMKIGMPAKTPGMPAMGGKGGAEVDLDTRFPWAKLSPDLKEKFTDGFFVLDPEGKHPDPEEVKPAPGMEGRQPPQVDPRQPVAGMFKGGSPYAAARFWERYPLPPMPPNWQAPGGEGVKAPAPTPVPANPGAMVKPYEALIRFIDPDVKPGKTYKYSIQVRIANPNFGKKTEVAFAALADVKELKPAAPVETPTITIPEEYFLYAVDQKPDNPKIQGGSDDKDAKADQVAIQIHRWVGATGDRESGVEYPIGDWAIAERLLLHRGDPVGRMVNIEIPVWDKKKGAYELGTSTAITKKAAEKITLPPKNLGKGPFPKKDDITVAEVVATGIPIDFTETTPPAVLVDFDGGKKTVNIGGTTAIRDESASNLLILRADGKLIVRNNRVDSDPDSPQTAARLQRIEEWKAKVGQYRQANPNMGVPQRGGENINQFLIPRKPG